MNKSKLSQLYWLNIEIKQTQERLRTVSYPPRTQRFLEGKIAENQERCLREAEKLYAFIETIEDSLLRQIFSLRYINGFNWVQVAMSIGAGNTPDGVRMMHTRYLNQLMSGKNGIELIGDEDCERPEERLCEEQ